MSTNIVEARNNLFLLPIFPPSSHSIVVFFFPAGLSLLSQNSQQVLLGVENVVITTKGLQERKTTIEWDDGGKIGKKNKLILTEILPSVHET